MKKLFIPVLFLLSLNTVYEQLSDPKLKATIEKINNNRDNIFNAFKGKKQRDNEYGDKYYTTIKLYGIKGSVVQSNYSEDMSFWITSDQYKKATRADFEKAYADISEALRSSFSDLEVREKQEEKIKALDLFEKGKDTRAPMAGEDSPKYSVSIQFREERTGGYSLFFFMICKRKKGQ